MPSTALQKMKWKEELNLHIINIPDSCLNLFPEKFNPEWPSENAFLVVFARDSNDVQEIAENFARMAKETGNTWLAYPKKTSGIPSDLSREILWGLLGTEGLSPVAQISINEQWSALRFKPGNQVSHSSNTSLDIPDNMRSTLMNNAEAMTFFYSLSATNRKEYIRWITDAKKPETVSKRLGELNNRLLAGLKNPSEKLT